MYLQLVANSVQVNFISYLSCWEGRHCCHIWFIVRNFRSYKEAIRNVLNVTHQLLVCVVESIWWKCEYRKEKLDSRNGRTLVWRWTRWSLIMCPCLVIRMRDKIKRIRKCGKLKNLCRSNNWKLYSWPGEK